MAIAGKPDHCPQFESFFDNFSDMMPISGKFTAHAKECSYCLYWLTHSLAIAEGCSLLPREELPYCPKRKAFRNLLIVSVRSQKKIRELSGNSEPSEETRKNVLAVTANEISKFAPLFQHLKECKPCHDYYGKLHDYETKAQKRYEEELFAGKELIPIALDENSTGFTDN